LRVLSSAERDIADALNWYVDRSVVAADRLEREIDNAFLQIKNQPDRFPLIDSRHRYVLLKSFPYYVAYRLVDDDVLIVAVRHTARDNS
jgi:plasmid stabilization system protein ParE